MSTHKICFDKANQKKNKYNTVTLHKHHLMSSSLIFFFFLNCTLSIGRYILYHKFSEYF